MPLRRIPEGIRNAWEIQLGFTRDATKMRQMCTSDALDETIVGTYLK